jgi:hypothetical protein
MAGSLPDHHAMEKQSILELEATAHGHGDKEAAWSIRL